VYDEDEQNGVTPDLRQETGWCWKNHHGWAAQMFIHSSVMI